jgi:PAS domain S-box-containing protein
VAAGGRVPRADELARRLAAAIEQTGDAVIVARADGTIEHANDAFLRAAGYSRAELASLTAADLAPPGFELTRGNVLEELTEKGMWRGTVERRRRDGTPYHASCTVVALRGRSGQITHLAAVERDISDEISRRDHLVHTERLSAMGALIAGVAHELNNPLQTILGSAEVLIEEHAVPTGRRELELVRHEAGRAAQIVRNLLAFVRRTTSDRAAADLNEVVRATVDLRRYHLERSNIVVRVELAGEALPVLVNREEIQQVVLNLILNAEQALEPRRGGTIAVRTFARGGGHVVEVADDGPGISRELRGRIFEPFFTTKDVGQGTGLGLSISHGIASAHGGSLELLTQHSPGACFQLTLPAHLETERAMAPPEDVSGSTRLALVVEDERPIRLLLRRLLERRGFEVAEADSGETALAVARDRSPALVLCDLRMPRMGGIELYRHVCSLRPALSRRFVLMSGHAAPEDGEQLPDVPTLHKPFTAADLDVVIERTQI